MAGQSAQEWLKSGEMADMHGGEERAEHLRMGELKVER